MVAAAVAPSSSPTPGAAVQQEPPYQSQEKKDSEADNGGHHHHHLGGALAAAAEKSNTAAVRKLRNREITSRYKAATVPGTLTPPATTTAAATTGPRRNSSPLRQPSPSRQSSSPARNRSPAATEASSPPVRHPSPTPGRASSVNSPSDAPKRSLSTERRRPWPAASARGSAEGGLASVKPRLVGAASAGGGRGSELWPSMNSASKQVQSSSSPNGTLRTTTPPPPPAAPNGGPPFEARGKESNRSNSDHSLKPTANGAHLDRSADRDLSSPQRKGSSPIRRRSIDQAENARPSANFLLKPDQQRWPGISNGKVFGGALTRSMDLSIDRERPLSRTATILIQSQQQPSSTPSRISRPSSASRSLNRSVNEGQTLPKVQATTPRQRNPTPTKGSRVVGPHISDSRSEAVVVCTTGNGAQQRSYSTAGDDMSNKNNLLLRSSRGVSSMGTLDSCIVPFDSMSDTESVSSGGSGLGSGGSARGTSVPARVWQDMNTRLRQLSEGDRIRSPKSELAAAAAAGAALGESKAVQQRSRVSSMGSQPSSPSTASMTGIMTSTCLLSPGGRVMSNNPGSISQVPSSPQYIKRSSSPLRGLPSPQRPRPVPGTTAMLGTGRNLGGCAIVNFGLDGWSRGRKALTQYEEAQLLRILHNRWLQWRFVNARAEAVISAQKTSAERSLYNVWVKTSELRTSVAKQRIKLQQARQAHRLRSILSTHVAHLEDWETLEEEHSSALTGAMEALESTILRVPVSGGAKVDVHAVGEALGSAVDVLNALQVSVSSLSPKAESMDVLLSQLAQTAAKERALLEECGDLLSVAATLEVEECSLRTHLIQLESEKGWSSATLPMSGSKPQLLKTILLSPPGVERHALELEKVEVAQAIKREGMGSKF